MNSKSNKYLGLCYTKYPHLNSFNSKPFIRNLFLEKSIIPLRAKRIIENPEMCYAINTLIQNLDCKMFDSSVLEDFEAEYDIMKSIIKENPTEEDLDPEEFDLIVYVATISSKLILWSFLFEPPSYLDLSEIFNEINVDTEFVIDLAASTINEATITELEVKTDELKEFLHTYSDYISQDSLDSLLDIYNKFSIKD